MKAAIYVLLMTAGCAGPSTFVSPGPPREAQVDTVFPKPVERVRSAIAQSMAAARLTILVAEGGPTVIVAEKHSA